MRDKRPVGDLSIEELERILAIRKREQRRERFRRDGRTVPVPVPGDEDMQVAVVPQQVAVATVDPPQPIEIEEDAMQEVRFVDDRPVGMAQVPMEAPWRRSVSWLLLSIEVAAVVGLAIVLYLGFVGLEDIQENTNETQRELSLARDRARITPTPLPDLSPTNLVLPGGHIYADESGQPAQNIFELYEAFDYHQIPSNVRPAIVQRFYSAPRQTTRQQQPTDPRILDIPAIGIQGASIIAGADWEELKAGVGWFNNGATLANGQNVVLVAHNDIYGEIFRDLEQLSPGDQVHIYASGDQRYTYRVTARDIKEPWEVQVLDPYSGADLTLITCHPYQVDTHRMVVFAELVE